MTTVAAVMAWAPNRRSGQGMRRPVRYRSRARNPMIAPSMPMGIHGASHVANPAASAIFARVV